MLHSTPPRQLCLLHVRTQVNSVCLALSASHSILHRHKPADTNRYRYVHTILLTIATATPLYLSTLPPSTRISSQYLPACLSFFSLIGIGQVPSLGGVCMCVCVSLTRSATRPIIHLQLDWSSLAALRAYTKASSSTHTHTLHTQPFDQSHLAYHSKALWTRGILPCSGLSPSRSWALSSIYIQTLSLLAHIVSSLYRLFLGLVHLVHRHRASLPVCPNGVYSTKCTGEEDCLLSACPACPWKTIGTRAPTWPSKPRPPMSEQQHTKDLQCSTPVRLFSSLHSSHRAASSSSA